LLSCTVLRVCFACSKSLSGSSEKAVVQNESRYGFVLRVGYFKTKSFCFLSMHIVAANQRQWQIVTYFSSCFLTFFCPVTDDPKKDQCMNFLTGFMTSYFCDVILTPLL
jgi:hypothetical protein